MRPTRASTSRPRPATFSSGSRARASARPLKADQKDLTEEEALAKTQAIRERLVKGEDFAVVAKGESDDTGSGAQGGDLGTFGRGRMVPVFEDAAFTQAVGAISEPVKSPFGYHLIQVQERNSKPFEEVRPEIEKRLQGENAKQAMDAVKNSSKPVLDEAYFGKPAAAIKPPAAAPKPPAAAVKPVAVKPATVKPPVAATKPPAAPVK